MRTRGHCLRRSGKGYSNWGGSTAAMCRSMCVSERGDSVQIRKYATELVALSPDVILVSGGSATQLLLQENPHGSLSSLTRSALATSKVCRDRAETRRVSCSSITA